MMNILLDILPEEVTVNGKTYFIDTDFRTFIIFEKIVLDPALTARERITNLLDLVYTEEVPIDVEAAFLAAVDVYKCGDSKPSRPSAVKKNGDVELKPKLIYDYEKDAPYIYAAFLQQYGIDLNEIVYMHWWKFHALFNGLTSSTKIVEIMGYRATDLSKIKDKDERARLAKLKRIYDLPTNYTYEDKVAMAGASFGGVAF